MEVDDSIKGARLRLVSDMGVGWPHPGDMGSALWWNVFDVGGGLEQRTLQVEWDNGSELVLVEGVDEWEWMEYTCANCDGTFTMGWTEIEADAEAIMLGIDPDGADTVVVCDDCFQRLRHHMAAALIQLLEDEP